jgi:hypothetical protein
MNRRVLAWMAILAGWSPAYSQSMPSNLNRYFDFAGPSPYRGGTLVFSALNSRLLTKGGHGFRNELKKKQALRKTMYETAERLSGTVKFNLSPGAKTIILQYHRNDEHTLVLLYVADSENPRLLNGKAVDRIFDVYVDELDVGGKEREFPLTTLRNGEPLTFSMENDRGNVTVEVNGQRAAFRTQDSEGTYLKFGDYLQAKDPVTDRQAEHGDIPDFYAKNGITTDSIEFSNVIYEPEVAPDRG